MIGRNEGSRLAPSLASVKAVRLPLVYADSGSRDESVATAGSMADAVVELDPRRPFSAARGRNEGFRELISRLPNLEFILFLDGDCVLEPDFVAAAEKALDSEPRAAAVCGRLREQLPHASLYNALCDEEWDIPPGATTACGGIAVFRSVALVEAGGFAEDLIAGEEPDLCLRLRKSGWRILRISDEMARHDADMHRFNQWWRRMRRSGYAFAALTSRHGAAAETEWRRAIARILFWALLLPTVIVAVLTTALISGSGAAVAAALLLIALYPVQIGRVAWRKARNGAPPRFAITSSAMLLIGKFAELGGIMRFGLGKLTHRPTKLIEHRSAGRG